MSLGSSQAGAMATGAAAMAAGLAATKCLYAAAQRMQDRSVVAAPFDSIETAIAAIRDGKPVVVMDDEDRENEGDIISRADCITDDIVSLLVNNTTGILCCPMPEEKADALELPPMLSTNEDPKGTAFTVTCDAKGGGVTTGVSSHDRAVTFRTLAAAETRPSEITRPGHIFPLRARPGGVLQRRGHTEATVDLCKLAGVTPAVGVIGELVLPDGTMMRSDDCKLFARRHGLPIITIDALVEYITDASPHLHEKALRLQGTQ